MARPDAMTGAVLVSAAAVAMAYLAAARHPARRRLAGLASIHRPPAAWSWLGLDRRRALALAAGAAAAGAAGPAVAVVAAVGAAGIVGTQRARHRSRELDATRAGVVAVTEALAAELDAGRTPGQALTLAAAEAGPLAGALTDVGAAVALGADAGPALRALAARPGADGLRAVAACWVVGATSGAALGAALARVVDLLDADARVRREVDVALAGPRATARVLAALPAVGLLLGAGLGGHPLTLLMTTPVGHGLAVGALVLQAIGWCWLRALVRRAQPP